MVSEALVKVAEENGGAIVEWKDVTWESDGCEDIQPSFPVMRIVQRMSSMEGASKHVGEFWHSDRVGNDAYEQEPVVVGLVKRDTRALFEEGKDKPACMSADGKVPLPNQPVWSQEYITLRDGEHAIPLTSQPTACSFCPFSMWGDKNEPPPCRESKVILVQREDKSLAQLRISGMSIRPFEQFVAKYLRPKGLPLYSKRLTLMTAERKRETKTWEEIEIHAESLSVTEAQGYAAILRAERERFAETVEGEVDGWDDESTGSQPFE